MESGEKKISNLKPLTSDLELIVAHFDHGIRKDSHKDEEFVKELVSKHHLVFETAQGKLGKKTSEAEARQARYKF